MFVYGIIAVSLGLIIIGMGVVVYNGNLKVIDEYHLRYVKDKQTYAREQGLMFSVLGIFNLVFGVLIIFINMKPMIEVIIHILGLIIIFIFMNKIQKKHNGRSFLG